MLAQFDNFRSLEGDAGKNRHGIEKNRNRGSVRNGAVVVNIGFAAIGRLVIVGRFNQRNRVAQRRSALGFGNCFGSRLRTGSGDQ